MAVNRDEFIQVIKNALHKAETDIETNIPHDLRNFARAEISVNVGATGIWADGKLQDVFIDDNAVVNTTLEFQ